MVELGCGGGGLCAMAGAKTCRYYTATDGSPAAVKLLRANLRANAAHFIRERVACCRLAWGNIAAASQVTKHGASALTERARSVPRKAKPAVAKSLGATKDRAHHSKKLLECSYAVANTVPLLLTTLGSNHHGIFVG